MSTYEPGQIVVVDVPFTGQTGAKRRPALIVSSEAFHRKLPDVISARSAASLDISSGPVWAIIRSALVKGGAPAPQHSSHLKHPGHRKRNRPEGPG